MLILGVNLRLGCSNGAAFCMIQQRQGVAQGQTAVGASLSKTPVF